MHPDLVRAPCLDDDAAQAVNAVVRDRSDDAPRLLAALLDSHESHRVLAHLADGRVDDDRFHIREGMRRTFHIREGIRRTFHIRASREAAAPKLKARGERARRIGRAAPLGRADGGARASGHVDAREDACELEQRDRRLELASTPARADSGADAVLRGPHTAGRLHLADELDGVSPQRRLPGAHPDRDLEAHHAGKHAACAHPLKQRKGGSAEISRLSAVH